MNVYALTGDTDWGGRGGGGTRARQGRRSGRGGGVGDGERRVKSAGERMVTSQPCQRNCRRAALCACAPKRGLVRVLTLLITVRDGHGPKTVRPLSMRQIPDRAGVRLHPLRCRTHRGGFPEIPVPSHSITGPNVPERQSQIRLDATARQRAAVP